MEILEPLITVELLAKKPVHLASYKNVWKVTVTPRILHKNPFKSTIIAASNGRTGNLQLENLGRFGEPGSQDLRPIMYYFYGESGTQTFKICVDVDRSKFFTKTITLQ